MNISSRDQLYQFLQEPAHLDAFKVVGKKAQKGLGNAIFTKVFLGHLQTEFKNKKLPLKASDKEIITSFFKYKIEEAGDLTTVKKVIKKICEDKFLSSEEKARKRAQAPAQPVLHLAVNKEIPVPPHAPKEKKEKAKSTLEPVQTTPVSSVQELREIGRRRYENAKKTGTNRPVKDQQDRQRPSKAKTIEEKNIELAIAASLKDVDNPETVIPTVDEDTDFEKAIALSLQFVKVEDEPEETATILLDTENQEQEIEQDLFGEDVFVTDTLDEDVEATNVGIAKPEDPVIEQPLQKVSDKAEEILPAIKVEPVVITTDEKKPEKEKPVVEKKLEEKKESFWDRIAAPFKSLGNCIANLFKKLFCINSKT